MHDLKFSLYPCPSVESYIITHSFPLSFVISILCTIWSLAYIPVQVLDYISPTLFLSFVISSILCKLNLFLYWRRYPTLFSESLIMNKLITRSLAGFITPVHAIQKVEEWVFPHFNLQRMSSLLCLTSKDWVLWNSVVRNSDRDLATLVGIERTIVE